MQKNFSDTSLLDLGQIWLCSAHYCKKSPPVVPVLTLQLIGHHAPDPGLVKRKRTKCLGSEQGSV